MYSGLLQFFRFLNFSTLSNKTLAEIAVFSMCALFGISATAADLGKARIAADPVTAVGVSWVSTSIAPGDSLTNHLLSFRSSFLYTHRAPLLPATVSQVASRFNIENPNVSTASRSIPLAFGLSAVLPGAGQVYNKQWIKAAVAITLEAVFVAGYISRKNDGNTLEDEYIAFAHEDWNPSQYGNWLNDFTEFLNISDNAGIDVPIILTDIGVDFQHPENWNSSDWESVRAMFSQINNTERNVYHPETGASFSHQLPEFAEQQYYELIGKYFQFSPGWSDYPPWITEDGEFTDAIDPEQSAPDGSKVNPSPKFYAYAELHAESQDLFRDASKFGLMIMVTHVVSAIDAAVSAKLHNQRIQPTMSMSVSADGRLAPVAGVGISLN